MRQLNSFVLHLGKPSWIPRLPGLLLVWFLSISSVFADAVVSNCNEQGLKNALAAGGTITFACSGTITNTATMVISNLVTLDAAGRTVTLNGGDQVRLFTVMAGASLKLRNINLARGAALGAEGSDGTIDSPGGKPGSPAMGGAILNNGGTVVLENCNVHGHRSDGGFGGNGYSSSDCNGPDAGGGGAGGAGLGGAIYQKSGTLILLNSCFQTNSVAGGAGGIGGNGGSCFTGRDGGNGRNGGHARGGAIYIESGLAGITNCTFDGNFTLGGFGGDGGNGSGGLGEGGDGGNGGNGEGAAIYHQNGTATLVNVTIGMGSLVRGGRGMGGMGGSSSIDGENGDPGLARGVCVARAAGSLTLMNSILDGQSAAINCQGTMADGGYNLSSDGSCNFTDHGWNNEDPLLQPLANNGGATLTLALASDSPAINAANPAAAPPTDQRGISRTGPPDIGAYESEITPITVTIQTLTPSLPESGLSNGVFRVTRTGSLTLPLTVNLDLAGSAVRDVDYTLVGISNILFNLVIPAGAASADLTLSVVPDMEFEGYEQIEVGLLAGSYTVGSPSTAVITIVDDMEDFVRPTLHVLEGPSDAGFGLSFETSSVGHYRVESSFNLVDWLALTNFNGTGGVVEFRDAESANHPQRFYRVRIEAGGN